MVCLPQVLKLCIGTEPNWQTFWTFSKTFDCKSFFFWLFERPRHRIIIFFIFEKVGCIIIFSFLSQCLKTHLPFQRSVPISYVMKFQVGEMNFLGRSPCLHSSQVAQCLPFSSILVYCVGLITSKPRASCRWCHQKPAEGWSCWGRQSVFLLFREQHLQLSPLLGSSGPFSLFGYSSPQFVLPDCPHPRFSLLSLGAVFSVTFHILV